jgi:hypothetical protein
LANPSATFCQEHGGIYAITTASDGSQAGTCALPDGTVCDGWAYFRGECGPSDTLPVPEITPTLAPTGGAGVGTTQNKAVEAARIALADKLNLPADSLKILSFEPVDWPDVCLGLADRGEVCAAVITPGFRVILQRGDQPYTVHTDLTGSVIRQETAGGKPGQ